MPLDAKNLEKALHLVGELLDSRRTECFQIVVCGGSALLAQGLISRPTHDVDILAMMNGEQREISNAHPLPPALKTAAEDVAKELHLEPNWLNSAASYHFPDLAALPPSFWTGHDERDYGSHLVVRFIPRSGQILLKLYAALNRAEPRDLDDLTALAPSTDETEEAAHWLLDAFPGLTQRHRLPELLTHLGHADLIQKLQG